MLAAPIFSDSGAAGNSEILPGFKVWSWVHRLTHLKIEM
jgi:hypothetical protein